MSSSHSMRVNPKCCRCKAPATVFRNQTNYCTLHYRIKQMIDDAKVDKKKVPLHQRA